MGMKIKTIFGLASVLSLFALCACATDADGDDGFDAGTVCPAEGTNAYGMPNRGTFVDERDGQEYKYTTIGNQVWMAQNLNYKMPSTEEVELKNPITNQNDNVGDYCFYEGDNCKTRGRVYLMLSAYFACPWGWHLPSEKEWNVLFNAVGKSAASLILRTATDWKTLIPEEKIEGEDLCGFGLLPAKKQSNNADGYIADFWTSTIFNSGYAMYYFRIQANFNGVETGADGGTATASVRCVKD